MENIKFTADTVCDLTPELLAEFDIAVAPLYVHFGDREVRDYFGIDQEIYQYYRDTKMTPKTSAVSVEDFKEFFRTHLPTNGSLIHFNISSEFSSSYANAVTAAKEFSNVYVIDSRTLTVGMVILILRAMQYRAQGLSAADIVQRTNAEINRVQTSFIIKDLTYLHRGGRCSGTTKLLATALGIRPQIVLRDGKMEVGKKFMGNFENCIKKYVDYVFATNPQPDLSICFIVHTQLANPQIVAEIKQQILARYPFQRIIESIPWGTVTSHCGENTIGIIYGI
ncbi:MAG: DegV family protein [Prevotella sp.]|nr:DegV family protein [Prevotella sp.]